MRYFRFLTSHDESRGDAVRCLPVVVRVEQLASTEVPAGETSRRKKKEKSGKIAVNAVHVHDRKSKSTFCKITEVTAELLYEKSGKNSNQSQTSGSCIAEPGPLLQKKSLANNSSGITIILP